MMGRALGYHPDEPDARDFDGRGQLRGSGQVLRMTDRSHWLIKRRFHGEYTSLLGLLNHAVLRWTPWRLAWRQDNDTGAHVGFAVVRAKDFCP